MLWIFGTRTNFLGIDDLTEYSLWALIFHFFFFMKLYFHEISYFYETSQDETAGQPSYPVPAVFALHFIPKHPTWWFFYLFNLCGSDSTHASYVY